ncbi:GNAT family N-acetyltransferase [Kurthia massiliensis]|uniref:GNAT family N-acetyltransferase n=1 Tax=Kurthia massiliensis TaxID=1033739 RepID=UPI00028A27BF|nr:GNAT family N-acetyltransferase [Kurthia massiliensis]
MNFELTDRGYELLKDGESIARIVWTLEDNVMQVTGTYTDESLRGQGIAGKLVDAAADYAREKGYKMKAICPYVVKKFEDTKYDDVNVEA